MMGVTGSGKTTVGGLLGRELGWRFYDADDFHPISNKEKMARGLPLTDEDREPWLSELSALIERESTRGSNGVLACSALKTAYREKLRSAGRDVRFVYLEAGESLIGGRLDNRRGHFMNPKLIESQFEALEAPEGEALTVDASLDPESIVEAIRAAFGV